MPDSQSPDDLRFHLGERPQEENPTQSNDAYRKLGDDLTNWAEDQIAPMAPPDRVWEHIAAHTQTVAKDSRAAASTLSLRLWQAAAVIFFAFNLLWIYRLNDQPAPPNASDNVASDQASSGVTPAAGDAFSNPNPSKATTAAVEQIERLQSTLAQRQTDLQALREQLAVAQSQSQALASERLAIESQLEGFFLPVDGKAQITLLSMAADRTPFTQADLDALLPAASRATSIDSLENGSFSTTAPEEDILPSPAAVAVWRNDLQEGIVNFYNMPELPEGATYQLWAEDSLTGETLNFGDLPSDSAGDFSITVTKESSTFTPSSLTVTINTNQGESSILIWGPGNPEAEPVENFSTP